MWMKIKAFLAKGLILYSIAACVIIGIGAWRTDIIKTRC